MMATQAQTIFAEDMEDPPFPKAEYHQTASIQIHRANMQKPFLPVDSRLLPDPTVKAPRPVTQAPWNSSFNHPCFSIQPPAQAFTQRTPRRSPEA
jgi:hypothetical protein